MEQSLISYIQGYLEFPETLNTTQSEDMEYRFEVETISWEDSNAQKGTPINIQQVQTIAYNWFVKELGNVYHEAFWNTAETLIDIIVIELLKNKASKWYLLEEENFSQIIVQSEKICIQLQFRSQEKEE